MRSFIFEGVVYRSLMSFAKAQKLSLSKLTRLCRHYQRPSEDPSIACIWMLEGFDPALEEKTEKYYRDLKKGKFRQRRFKVRVRESVRESLC